VKYHLKNSFSLGKLELGMIAEVVGGDRGGRGGVEWGLNGGVGREVGF